MKLIPIILAAISLAAFTRTAIAAPSDERLSLTSGADGTWDIDWSGVSGRTYFVQWSPDLENWSYAPVVEFETPQAPYSTDFQGELQYFVRLRYVDASWVGSLQEARDEDFDGDGIANWFEVEHLFSDPLDGTSAGGDTDNGGAGDGLSDGWEFFFFGDLTTADPAAIGQADGLTNKEKSDLGLNPNIDYSDPNNTQPSKFTYDLAGRLTDVTAPVAATTFTPDQEGNLLNTQ